MVFLQLFLIICILNIPAFVKHSERLSSSGTGNASSRFTRFMNPQEVIIDNLPMGSGGTPISVEEPFVSRDERFLFFNTAQSENNKDLHYAENKNGRWSYGGEIGPGINDGKEVQGNPTMDDSYNFYFVNSGIKRMISKARFLPERKELENVMEFDAVPERELRFFRQRLTGNMGVEISPDGDTVYFSRATWKLRGFKISAIAHSDILLIIRKNGKYIYDEAEARHYMKNVNTGDLEYAASISEDGLALFFTRLMNADLNSGNIRSRIMVSTRDSKTEPFGSPVEIRAIGNSDFVEGPAISDKGRTLYYHKRVHNKFRLFKVTRNLVKK